MAERLARRRRSGFDAVDSEGRLLHGPLLEVGDGCAAFADPAYGGAGGTSLRSEVSATQRRRPHADGEEGARIVPHTVATFRPAAQGVARPAPQEPARSRPGCRNLPAPPELRGERAI